MGHPVVCRKYLALRKCLITKKESRKCLYLNTALKLIHLYKCTLYSAVYLFTAHLCPLHSTLSHVPAVKEVTHVWGDVWTKKNEVCWSSEICGDSLVSMVAIVVIWIEVQLKLIQTTEGKSLWKSEFQTNCRDTTNDLKYKKINTINRIHSINILP